MDRWHPFLTHGVHHILHHKLVVCRSVFCQWLCCLRWQCFSSKMQCKAKIRRCRLIFTFLLLILVKISLRLVTDYAPSEQIFFGDGQQDGPWRRRRKMTTVLTAVWMFCPDGRPCVASLNNWLWLCGTAGMADLSGVWFSSRYVGFLSFQTAVEQAQLRSLRTVITWKRCGNEHPFLLKLFCNFCVWNFFCVVLVKMPPFPQIDIIRAVMIVWRVRGKIIRSVLCNNCAQCNAHTYEQT